MSDYFAGMLEELTGRKIVGDSPTATAAQQVLTDATAWQTSVQAAVPSTSSSASSSSAPSLPAAGAPGGDGSSGSTGMPDTSGAGTGGGGGGGGGLDFGGGGGDGGDFGGGDDGGEDVADFGASADQADQGDVGLPSDMSTSVPDQGDLESTLPDQSDESVIDNSDDSDFNTVDDSSDPYANIVGELNGSKKKALKRRVVGQDKPTIKPSVTPFLSRPLWSGSPVHVWQALVGAGVALALSTVLFSARRKR